MRVQEIRLPLVEVLPLVLLGTANTKWFENEFELVALWFPSYGACRNVRACFNSVSIPPGVEYRMLRMADPDTDQDVFYHQPGADYELKPIHPLVSQLERPWPVRVKERDIPTLSALGSLCTAVTSLGTACLISHAISLCFIPSRSMDPTLQIGDVLLVS